MIHKTLSLTDSELKFKGDKGTFTGYASVFGGIDSYNDTIVQGAFKNVIGKGKMPKMFENHKAWELPIGKWLSMEEDSKGLLVTGEFTPNHAKAEMVRASMQHGTLDGLSIGFRMQKGDYEYDEEEIRVIKNISELIEISAVTFPADDNARIDLNSVKSEIDNIRTIRDLEAFLRDEGGFSNGLVKSLLIQAKSIFSQDERYDDNADEKAQAIKLLLQTPSF